jgi:hypothetical protein
MLPTSAAGGAEMSLPLSAARIMMAEEIYEDEKLAHLWEQSARWLVQMVHQSCFPLCCRQLQFLQM